MSKQASTIDRDRALSDAVVMAAASFDVSDRIYEQGKALESIRTFEESPAEVARLVSSERARRAVPASEWAPATDSKGNVTGPETYSAWVASVTGKGGVFTVSESTVSKYRSAWKLVGTAGLTPTVDTFRDAWNITVAGKVKPGTTAANRISAQPESERAAAFHRASVALTGVAGLQAESRAAAATASREAAAEARKAAESDPVGTILGTLAGLITSLSETAEVEALTRLVSGLTAARDVADAARETAATLALGTSETAEAPTA